MTPPRKRGKSRDVTEMTILSPRILLAEDDEIMRVTLYDRLTQKGWEVEEAEDGKVALDMLKEGKYHLVLSDIRMPKLDGSRLLEKILQLSPSTDVIMMTAYGSVEDAITCLKKGAADYILKPFDMDDITIRIERLLEMQAIKARCVSLEECYRQAIHPIIGSSPAMQSLLKIISQVAVTDSSVLVSGESGTGKELVARAIHFNGVRKDEPFVTENCAPIPDTLLESELFGYVRGA
ncbi:MAG: sigma-54-dependent Fis family transcriptional regulator, partial [Desulfobulbaceae bacterium]|nr:sigma-54-dependent Fis family transcriptional regulator [Desulfobulbaceae bacterium]